jgi:hypothetical protein
VSSHPASTTKTSYYIPHKIPSKKIIQNGLVRYALKPMDSLHSSTVPGADSPSDSNEENYQRVYENDNFEENKGSLGHEVLAGGAAFAGFKMFEDRQRAEG